MSGDFGTPEAREFFDQVREQSIVGRLSGLRRVPFNTRMLRFVNGATGYWVSEGAVKPLTKPALEGESLPSRKVASIIVQTKEAVQAAGSVAESALQRELERALVDIWDQAFIDVANGGIPGNTPASITYGAT